MRARWVTLGVLAAALIASAGPASAAAGLTGPGALHASVATGLSVSPATGLAVRPPAEATRPLPARPTPAQALRLALRRGLRLAGAASGAYVVDLTIGRVLFAAKAGVARLPASVEKLYTTTTALLRFGPDATLSTQLLGTGAQDGSGRWTGTLYLKGGGDPTFGSAAYDQTAYGTGATVQELVENTLSAVAITSLRGAIDADPSYLDGDRGTPATGNAFSPYLEGSLSAIAFNRGLLPGGTQSVSHPAFYAARKLASALRTAGVKVPRPTAIGAAVAPPRARLLGAVQSPPMATLIALTNTPSDNFFAEMLLKDLGAAFGRAGTTAAGAAVVRAELAGTFRLHPVLVDGSGLSRQDHTTPRQVVTLLGAMAGNSDFVHSLAVAGETGTLQSEMVGTLAQGRCRGKTGTLQDVSNLVGYCHARDGHTLAFAFLMNAINPDYAHPIQDAMAVALASYGG